ncbi:MAG: permease of phosphate ABC transporter [Oscillospiraceae bacterium]
MLKLIDKGEKYLKTMRWYDLGFLKVCLLSLGMMLGLCVKDKHKKPCFIVCTCIFVGTYIPAMARFIFFLFHKKSK